MEKSSLLSGNNRKRTATNKNKPTFFEATLQQLGIRHKLIHPYTPRHNGKVERSHREDQKRFYNKRSFYSLADFGGHLAAHQRKNN
ncbi:MAG: integrase core domain-containing protein [Clostridia bacterium]|nr:integrase core domain-containing protein [Clostridia bacterium]